MYTEPNWSSFTLPELLEKARAFGNKVYSGSLSPSAFLERARENSPKHPDLSDEILNLAERVKAEIGEVN